MSHRFSLTSWKSKIGWLCTLYLLFYAYCVIMYHLPFAFTLTHRYECVAVASSPPTEDAAAVADFDAVDSLSFDAIATGDIAVDAATAGAGGTAGAATTTTMLVGRPIGKME